MLRMRFCARSLFISLTIAALVAGAPVFAADDPAASETKPGDAAGPQTQAPKDKPDEQAPKTPEQARADLYARLAVAKDADETAGIITLLLHSYAESGSDTGDFLLQRARKAISAEEYPDALKILDATIALLPDWAEGWNARATARYLDDDYNGSMADIAQTLKREPQHLGALMGGWPPSSRRAARKRTRSRSTNGRWRIAPHWRNAQEAADKLKAALAGEELREAADRSAAPRDLSLPLLADPALAIGGHSAMTAGLHAARAAIWPLGRSLGPVLAGGGAQKLFVGLKIEKLRQLLSASGPALAEVPGSQASTLSP